LKFTNFALLVIDQATIWLVIRLYVSWCEFRACS